MPDLIISILTGSVMVAVIEGVREYLAWRRKRKAEKEDRQELDDAKWRKEVNDSLAALKDANKWVLYDRIRYLGQAYIADGEIDFDDRRILNNMHGVYHNGLGANGDLDGLMKEVNRLPLKKKVAE